MRNCVYLLLEILKSSKSGDFAQRGDNFEWNLRGDTFLQYLENGFSKANSNEKQFGKTLLAWRGDVDKIGLFGSKNGTENGPTHAATYIGTSKNGTEYTFSKNGLLVVPKVQTTTSLKSIYGNKVSYWNPR